MSEDYLPLILVSAADQRNASNLISEIIGDEPADAEQARLGGRVWRLRNKYYSAHVELCAAAPQHPAPDAHLIHLAQGEAEREAEARRPAGGPRAAVRLLACEAEAAGAALEAWARRHGYEAVPLREPAPPDGSPAEAYGLRRLREALHAHPWRGLRRHGEGAGDPERPEGEADVERVEAFAEALGALEGAGEAARALPDDERRERAERMLGAFCRALGLELSAL